jgi:hypothetical protein
LLTRAPPETLAAATDDSPPPPLSRRREVVQEPRKEVRCSPASLVVELVHPDALETSPEPATRSAVSTSRITAAAVASSCFASSRASCRCFPHTEPRPETLVWVSPVSSAAAYCRPPPSRVAPRRPAACSRPRPLDLDLTRRIQTTAPQTPSTVGSRSNGSRSGQT